MSSPEWTLPHNVEAEQSVLGSILLDRDAVAPVAATLKPDDFFDSRNGLVYRAMLVLYARGEPTDLVTLSTHLSRTRQLDAVGGPAYLSSLLLAVPAATHVEHYARIVVDMAVLRRLVAGGAKIVSLGYDTSREVQEQVAEAQRIVAGIETAGTLDDMVPFSESVPQFIRSLEREWSGEVERDVIGTGFRSLDNAMDGGFSGEELVYLAARPSIGKTALALQLALNFARSEHGAAKQGHAPRWTAIFSAEMSQRSILHRALGETSTVPITDLKTGQLTKEALARIREARDYMSKLPVVMNDRSRPTTEQILQRLDRWQRTVGPVRFVVFDYIELAGDTLANRNANEEQRISAISKGFKRIAKEIGCTVLVLSQLNRNVEARASKVPQLSDIRQSGSIEQDADKVLFLYRQDYYAERDMLDPSQIVPEKRGVADVIIAKNRDGAVGTYPLRFSPTLTAFSSMEDRPR